MLTAHFPIGAGGILWCMSSLCPGITPFFWKLLMCCLYSVPKTPWHLDWCVVFAVCATELCMCVNDALLVSLLLPFSCCTDEYIMDTERYFNLQISIGELSTVTQYAVALHAPHPTWSWILSQCFPGCMPLVSILFFFFLNEMLVPMVLCFWYLDWALWTFQLLHLSAVSCSLSSF